MAYKGAADHKHKFTKELKDREERLNDNQVRVTKKCEFPGCESTFRLIVRRPAPPAYEEVTLKCGRRERVRRQSPARGYLYCPEHKKNEPVTKRRDVK